MPVMLPRGVRPARSSRRGRERVDAGRVAFRRGGLARGQSDLTLGHGHAGERVHHEQDG